MYMLQEHGDSANDKILQIIPMTKIDCTQVMMKIHMRNLTTNHRVVIQGGGTEREEKEMEKGERKKEKKNPP